MAKYSTGGSGGGGDGDACELCGESSDRLREAEVAGAQLLVCPDCAPHDDAAKRGGGGGSGGGGGGSGGGGGGSGGGRTQDDHSGPPTGGGGTSELWDSDTSEWEQEGTDYESDPLPYLVTDYGGAVTEARQEEGLQIDELAEDLGVPEDDLLAVEQGRAARAGIGGSLVEALEERLDVDLVEDN
jgi:ribosome-binding protein aMBF1 (putative translation factor)